MKNRKMQKEKIVMAICVLLAIICVTYGILILSAAAGTKFFLVWFGIAILLLTIGAVVYFGLWTKLPSILRKIIVFLFIIGMLSFVIIECLIASKLNTKGTSDLDYLIVLGAQVRENGPSVVLKYRLDKAIDYLKNNPNTICIVSGGKGHNEPFAEAEGMADYLIKKGIPKDRLLLEAKSKTTEQNITNSMTLMDKKSSVGVLTNNFHLFRAMQIAKRQGLQNACGIAADSPAFYLPNNMLREYFAEIKTLLVH